MLIDNTNDLKLEIDYQLDELPFLILYLAQKIEIIRNDILDHYEKFYGIEVDPNRLMTDKPLF